METVLLLYLQRLIITIDVIVVKNFIEKFILTHVPILIRILLHTGAAERH